MTASQLKAHFPDLYKKMARLAVLEDAAEAATSKPKLYRLLVLKWLKKRYHRLVGSVMKDAKRVPGYENPSLDIFNLVDAVAQEEKEAAAMRRK